MDKSSCLRVLLSWWVVSAAASNPAFRPALHTGETTDLFGIKEHDQRHDEVERQLRRLIEQVAQLGIDLGVTRTELRKLDLTVAGKVSEADLDPSFAAVNSGVIEAREKLAAA
ncbi:MAG: hypothetical protein O7C01_09420 [Actinobacteria bacterium]|nr:hypothetical protein [Actinomycetota bacterium]